MEFELRYRLDEEETAALEERLSWSPAVRVCDLTLGPSGATSMQTDGWVVRLRQSGAKTRMEYKAPKNAEWSAWVEYGTDVGDMAETIRILTAVGLRPGLLLDRTRRTATYGPATLSLDNLRGLGTFVEIEIETDGQGLDAGRTLLESIRSDLGIPERPSQRPYGELMLGLLERDEVFRKAHDEMIEQILQ
jgi:predicted adenylyl cyclase CyaB